MLNSVFRKDNFLKTESLFFFSLVLISLLPVWMVDYFPSQDGPLHLWILKIISSYSAPDGQILREFLEPNKYMEPNLGFYFIAYPFSLLFGIAAAEKIFLSLLTLIFCYGVRYAISLINKDAIALSYLSVPMVFGYFTHMGFYNFLLGVALFLPLFTFCIVQYHRGSLRGYWKIGAASLVLVLSHLVSFGAFLFSFGLYVVAYRIVDMIRIREFRLPLSRLMLESVALFAAVLPGIIITASFALRHGLTENPTSSEGLRFFWHYWCLFCLHFLQSFDGIEALLVVFPYWIALVGAVSFTAWSIFRNRPISSQSISLLIMLLGLLILYLHAPITSKNIPLNPRLAPLVVLTGILVMAAVSRHTRFSFVIVLCTIVIITGAGYRYFQYSKFNQEMDQMLSLTKHLDYSSSLLIINNEPNGNPMIRKFYGINNTTDSMLHAGAYFAIQKQGIYLRATLLSPSWFAYFPFVFRPGHDPFIILGRTIQHIKPNVDFDQFRQVIGRSIDYLILVGPILEKDLITNVATSQLQRELDSNYKWLDSSTNGRFQLYGSKERHPPAVVRR